MDRLEESQRPASACDSSNGWCSVPKVADDAVVVDDTADADADTSGTDSGGGAVTGNRGCSSGWCRVINRISLFTGDVFGRSGMLMLL